MSALDLWRGSSPSDLFRTMQPVAQDMERVMREMDRMMMPMRTLAGSAFQFTPVCDIVEDENEYNLTLEVPGLSKDDIEIEVLGSSVRIAGEKKQESEKKGRNKYMVERSYGAFSRTFSLPEGVRSEDIEANYQNGVLFLTMPKSEKSKAKRVQIHDGKSGFVAKLNNKNKSKDG